MTEAKHEAKMRARILWDLYEHSVILVREVQTAFGISGADFAAILSRPVDWGWVEYSPYGEPRYSLTDKGRAMLAVAEAGANEVLRRPR